MYFSLNFREKIKKEREKFKKEIDTNWRRNENERMSKTRGSNLKQAQSNLY